jgi:hypothetical protein
MGLPIALIAVLISSCDGPTYVYARPSIQSVSENGGTIEVSWEAFNTVQSIKRYSWCELKGGWDFDFEDAVKSSMYYVDDSNLVPGTTYGYTVYDGIEESGLRSINYRGPRAVKDDTNQGK